MVYDFKFPDVGEGITEGKLVEWKVKVGDQIKIDDTIASDETDKAVVDIPSPVSGKIIELNNKIGDTINVGDVFVRIQTENIEKNSEINNSKENENNFETELKPIGLDKKIGKQTQNSSEFEIEEIEEIPREDVSSKKEPIKINGETIYPKENKKIEIPELKSSQSEIKKENNIYEDTNKNKEILAMPYVRIEAKKKGINLENITPTGKHGEITIKDLETQKNNSLNYSENKEFKTKNIENVIKDINEPLEKELNEIKEEVEKKSEVIKRTTQHTKDIIASPHVRRLANLSGIDLSTIKGSGKFGRVVEEDLNFNNNSQNKNYEKYSDQKITNNEFENEDIEVPFSQIRKVIAKRMLESLQKTAQVTHSDKANLNQLVKLKELQKEELKKDGIKFSYIPFFIKAFIATCKKYPKFNAIVNEEKQSLIIKKHFDIAIAVDTKEGLLVPVLRNCENKSIIELFVELNEIILKAREGNLTPSEMSNSTFTISSVGNLGGEIFTPIINYPEVAILGVGKIKKEPFVNLENKIEIGNSVNFSLTFDHRVLDGADAAKFLSLYIEYIEDIDRLLMEIK